MQINESNYVDMAENAIKELIKEKSPRDKIVTTSKIRNLLAMVADIYNDVINNKAEELGDDIVVRINYMKVQFYYSAGREDSVKKLLKQANVLRIIDEIGNSRSNYIIFSRYMEALVAFRKYYGGIDD